MAVNALREAALQPDEELTGEWTELKARTNDMKNKMNSGVNSVLMELSALKEKASKLDGQVTEKENQATAHKADRDGLEQQLENLKNNTESTLRKNKATVIKIENSKIDATNANGVVKKANDENRSVSLPIDNGGMYLRFLTGRAQVLTSLAAATSRFESLVSIDAKVWSASPSAASNSSLKHLASEVYAFEDQLEFARKEQPILEKLSIRLKHGGFDVPDLDITKSGELLQRAEEAHANWTRKVSTEEERRVNYESGVDEFMKEQARLIDWCTTQKETLSQLPATENVQEFCSSLQGRIPMMEENFSVLTGMGEDLIPGPQQKLVEKTLADVRRVWIDLQIFSYEKYRDALLAEHAKSNLKEESQQFTQWASQNIKGFLDRVEELFRTPDEEESRDIVQPALDMCKLLQSDYAPHQLITEHVADFDMRMEVIDDHYKYLKKTLTSPLTFLCQKLTAFDSGYHRKDEYEERVRDLQDWVDIKESNVTSWKEAHSKVSEVSEMVRRELENDAIMQ